MFAIKRKLKLNKSEEALMAQYVGFFRLVYNYVLHWTVSSRQFWLKQELLKDVLGCLVNKEQFSLQGSWDCQNLYTAGSTLKKKLRETLKEFLDLLFLPYLREKGVNSESIINSPS